MFDIWKNVLAEIEQQIPHDAFITWFDNVTLAALEDGVATVSVPSVIKQSQIQKKYYQIIKTAFKNHQVEVKEIAFTTSRPKTRRLNREITASDVYADRVVKFAPRSAAKATFQTNLNKNYTLENFVIGSNNDLAVSVAKQIIKQPGGRYNPFFLYGGSGLGKTHLVQAIGNALVVAHPRLRVLYTTTNHFYSEFIQAIRESKGDDFAKKYQKLDVLIIDDFQMIIGKNASQEEFFNIFNDMYQNNRQIIVTSDRLPDQIKSVDARLASRLAWAGPIDLQFPSFEDKCAILRAKADFMGVFIEDEAIEAIAGAVKTNIRELEGEFNRIVTLADLREKTPLELIHAGYLTGATAGGSIKRALTPEKIIQAVARRYQITPEELTSKSRVKEIKNARQLAMYLMSEELGLSTTKIAREVGVKDHTTVMHGIKKVRENLSTDYAVRERVETIREELY